MKQTLLAFVFTAFLTSCQAAADTQTFTVTDVKSGLWCPSMHVPNSEIPGAVCHETETFQITGQSLCRLGDVENPCTWYGFEFAYSGSREGTALDCFVTAETATNFVSPNAPTLSERDSLEFSIEIPEGSGRLTNPQFSIFSTVGDGETRENRFETVCSYQGNPVFSFSYKTIFPQALTSAR